MTNTYHPRGLKVHGFSVREHPAYHIWAMMKQRCDNPNAKGYSYYGGRGIGYCTSWCNFENFARDMGLPPFEGATLDRVDNNLGYCKSNCRWVNRTEQALNRSLFKNNSSGRTGVVRLKNGTFVARYDEYGQRFNLGRFDTLDAASKYRDRFIELLSSDTAAALKMTIRRTNRNSSTGINGVSRAKDGYIVRFTRDGVRNYLGYAPTIEDAVQILMGAK